MNKWRVCNKVTVLYTEELSKRWLWLDDCSVHSIDRCGTNRFLKWRYDTVNSKLLTELIE